MSASKKCEACGTVFFKRQAGTKKWLARKYCSRACSQGINLPKYAIPSRYRELTERFMEFVSPEPNSGCWLWLGHLSRTGYGRFRSSVRRSDEAYRVSYRLFKGPIPTGMVVRHQCDVRACVNPDHLIVGTQAENVADAIARGRHRAPSREGGRPR